MVGGTALAVSVDGETSPVLVVGLAVALVMVHLGAGRVGLTGRIPRSGWLSFAGGTSIAYVFVHLLPELEAGGREIAPVREALPSFLEYHVYLVALVGFVVFYGLERFVTRARASDETAPDGVSGDGVFWIHVGSFALYNALVGYSLYERETALAAVLFAVAMGFHFVVNDAGFRRDDEARYHRIGRWVLAGAVLGGALVGTVVSVDEALLAVVNAFLGGGVILNVIKEELPEERESRFVAFAAGAAGYAAVLLVV